MARVPSSPPDPTKLMGRGQASRKSSPNPRPPPTPRFAAMRCALLLLCGAGAVFGQDELGLEEDFADLEFTVPVWIRGGSLEARSGWGDNLLLGSGKRVAGGYGALLGEGFVSHPEAGFTAFALGDYRFFHRSPEVPDEVFLFTMARWQPPAWTAWQISGGYYYSQQGLDISAVDLAQGTSVIRLQQGLLRSQHRLALGQTFALGLHLSGHRSFYQVSIDDQWEARGRLELEWKYAPKARRFLAAAWHPRWYDSRPASRVPSSPSSSKTLRFEQTTLEAGGEHLWASGWELRDRWRWQRRIDNGGGWFGQESSRASLALLRRSDRGYLQLSASSEWVRYSVQTVSAADPRPLARLEWSLSLEFRYPIRPDWEITLNLHRDGVRSRRTDESYRALRFEGGFKREW